MPLTYRKMAVLAKLETSYAVDSTPTGAANAILARNVSVTPITTVREARDLYRPFLGNSSDVIGAFYGQISYDVEAAGAGTAGGVPGYDTLLRACGFARVNTPGVSTVYTPVSGGFDSAVQYFHLDGTLHKLLGTRGNVSFSGSYRSATMWKFNFQGLFVPVTDLALPTADYSGFQDPLAFNKANTPTFTVHGVSGVVLRNLSFDMGNQVVYRNLINSEVVRIVDRKPVGSMEISSELMAVKNWFNTVRDATTGPLHLVHGTTAGNIVELDMPAVQLNEIALGNFEGDAMLTATTKLMPSGAGNNEVTITVR